MQNYVEVSVINSSAAPQIGQIIEEHKTSKAKQPKDSQSTSVYRVHFPATKQLFDLLQSLNYPYEKNAYRDMYLDTRHYELAQQGFWYKKRYTFNYENELFEVLETSLKQRHCESEDFLPILISCTKLPNEDVYQNKLLPLAAYTFMRHSFKTEFGYLRIEEVSFNPDVAYLLATAIVVDKAEFDTFYKQHNLVDVMALGPVATKIVECIRIVNTTRPKQVEPLWNALLKSRAVPSQDWSSDICRFNPLILGFPISDNDAFWKRKGDLILSPEEID